MSIELIASGTGKYTTPTVCKRNASELPYLGLVHLCRGSGFFWSPASNEMQVNAGDTILLIPGIAHSYGTRDGGLWSECWLLLGGEAVSKYLDKGLLISECPIVRDSSPELWTEMTRVAGTGVADEAYRHFLTLALLGLTISRILQPQPSESNPVSIVEAEMLKHIANESFNFQGCVRDIGYSSVHMRRLFKAGTGCTPVAYFNHLKTQEAKNQLIYSSRSVKSVASGLGWKDDAYFRRVFRKAEGISPSEWRRRHRNVL